MTFTFPSFYSHTPYIMLPPLRLKTPEMDPNKVCKGIMFVLCKYYCLQALRMKGGFGKTAYMEGLRAMTKLNPRNPNNKHRVLISTGFDGCDWTKEY